MGMAASQARLLFITTRQSDVTAQLERISNDHIILAKDESKIAEQYDRMLNAKKQVAKDGVNLSYESMMGASAASSGMPKIVSDTSGHVVLSRALSESYGLPLVGDQGEIKRVYATPADFISKVANITDKDKINEVLNNLKPDKEPTPSVQGVATEFWPSNFGGWVNNVGSDLNMNTAPYSTDYTSYDETSNTLSFMSMKSKDNDTTGLSILGQSKGEKFNEDMNNTMGRDNKLVSREFSLYNLIGRNDDIRDIAVLGQGSSSDLNEVAIKNLNTIGTGIGSMILKGLVDAGLDESSIKSIINNAVNDTEKSYSSKLIKENETRNNAYAKYKENYKGGVLKNEQSWLFDDWSQKYNEDAATIATLAVMNQEHIAVARFYQDDAAIGANGKEGFVYTLDVGKFAEDILDKVLKQVTTNYDDIYKVNKLTGEPTVREPEGTIKFKDNFSSSVSQSANTEIDKETSIIKYYNNIYNSIDKNGWVSDDAVLDSKTFQDGLADGKYLINGKQIDISSNFEWVDDEEMQKRAEIFKETEEKKIKNKEKKLDAEEAKLQTELTALNNDYTSVKGIIEANIQKSFSYCSNA